ncbi:MAG: choice-of-anchor D domain-containing protein, partial [Bacteroidales bacterium]|nr:choice-of-anchor D domain-containing protein [Bacteroidales bacterium]
EKIYELTGKTKILAWIAYADLKTEYPNTLNALSQYYTDYSITTSETEIADSLKQQLKGMDILLLPEQENPAAGQLQTIGVNFKKVLTEFVERGGYVISCGGMYNQEFLNGSDLTGLNFVTTSGGILTVIDSLHPICNGISAHPASQNATFGYKGYDATLNSLVELNGNIVVAEKSIKQGGLIMVGYDYFNYDDDAAKLIANAVQWADNGIEWLISGFNTDTIAAGDSQDVDITFVSTGLFSGVYQKNINIASNDPVNSPVVVPATLSVTGVPELSYTPDTIDFGNLYAGYPGYDTLTLINTGTDTLQIFGISTEDSNLIVMNQAASLMFEEELTVPLEYVSLVAGNISGNVKVFSNSDLKLDTLMVPFVAYVMEPPVMTVTPDSMSLVLNSGDSLFTSIVVGNSGANDLFVELNIESNDKKEIVNEDFIERIKELGGTFVSSDNSAITYQINGSYNNDGIETDYSYENTVELANETNGKTVMFATTYWNSFQLELEALGYTTIVNSDTVTPSSLNTVDLLVIDDNFNPSSTEVAYVNNWIRKGGNLMIDADSDLGSFNKLIDGSGITYINTYPSSGVTKDITSHEITEGITEYHIGGGAVATLSVTGEALDVIRDKTGLPHVAVSTIGKGRVVTICDESLQGGAFSYTGHQELGFNAVDWLCFNKTSWLNIITTNDTIAAGDSSLIEVLIDARELYGGMYSADIIVTSNDPATPEITVPVNLQVIGYPVLSVNVDTISFGNVLLGDTRKDTIRVFNKGNDILYILDMYSNDSAASVVYYEKEVLPGESFLAEIEFSPGTEGWTWGDIIIESNDSTNPVYSIMFNGYGQ